MKDVQWRWPVGLPLVDSLGGGLFEVRTTSNRVEYRVFFCISNGAMVLLHGFAKKSRKAPKGDVELARERQRRMEQRK